MKRDRIDFGIITAMPIEMEAVIPFVTDLEEVSFSNTNFVKGSIGNRTIALCTSGMGQTNAAIATLELLYNFDPKNAVFCGIAGAVSPDLQIGDVVIGRTILPLDIQALHDINKINPCKFSGLPAQKYLSDEKLMNTLLNESREIELGTIATSDNFPHPISMPTSFDGDPILCIDMESSAFSQCCEKMHKPFIVIRSISNVTNNDKNYSGITMEPAKLASQNAAQVAIKLIRKYND